MDELSRLVKRSKAYWGYDDEFMAKAAPDLIVTEAKLPTTWVAEMDGQSAGVVALMPINGDIDLDMFFVDPALLRSGLGRVMCDFAVQKARALGAGKLIVVSEPNAEEFYLRMGAVRVGESYSQSTERNLPLLEFELLTLRPDA